MKIIILGVYQWYWILYEEGFLYYEAKIVNISNASISHHQPLQLLYLSCLHIKITCVPIHYQVAFPLLLICMGEILQVDDNGAVDTEKSIRGNSLFDLAQLHAYHLSFA